MSIKLLAKISLPYYIRLKYTEKLETELAKDDDFSFFRVVFYPNTDEIENKNYSPMYRENLCNTIEVEAVINNYHHTEYSLEKNSIYDTYEVTDNDRTEIFKLVKDKLNHFLLYISKASKMFWINDLPINPVSDVIGIRTDFIFVNPGEAISMNSRVWSSIQDNFMVDLYSNSLKPIDQNMLEEYKDKYIVHFTWNTYINKANKAIYTSEYEEFIIYCAIAAESFIKQFVGANPLRPSRADDVVLNKLMTVGKSNMVDTYFKVILKYLFGTNLLEMDEKLYKNLKDIFILRNDIMHKGVLDENSFKAVGINNLDYEQACIYLERLNLAIKTCFEMAFTNQ